MCPACRTDIFFLLGARPHVRASFVRKARVSAFWASIVDRCALADVRRGMPLSQVAEVWYGACRSPRPSTVDEPLRGTSKRDYFPEDHGLHHYQVVKIQNHEVKIQPDSEARSQIGKESARLSKKGFAGVARALRHCCKSCKFLLRPHRGRANARNCAD
jgi:hypothetical protein